MEIIDIFFFLALIAAEFIRVAIVWQANFIRPKIYYTY